MSIISFSQAQSNHDNASPDDGSHDECICCGEYLAAGEEAICDPCREEEGE